MANLDQGALAKVFHSDPEVRAEGRALVVSGASIEDFYQCADFAKGINDEDSLEFWLVEVVTSRAQSATIAAAIFRLAEEVLQPQGRFFEGSVYLKYIARAVTGDTEAKALVLLERFENQARIGTEIVQSQAWRDFDISQSMALGQSQQYYYDRFMAYFSAVHDQTMVPLFEELQFDYLPNIFGYFIGLTSSLKEKGVKSETAIQAFSDYQNMFFSDFKPGIPKQLTSGSAYASVMHQEREAPVATKNIGGYGLSKS